MKQYKLLKNTLGFGNIIKGGLIFVEKDRHYQNYPSGYIFSKKIVENNPDFFELVPSVSESVSENIEVTKMVRFKQTNLVGNEPHLHIYFNKWPSLDKHEEIQQAVEKALNEDTVVEDNSETENKIISFLSNKFYTQSEVDAMMEDNKYKEAYDKLLALHTRLYNDYADLIEATLPLQPVPMQEEKHKCQFCGAMTSQDYKYCYKNPNGISMCDEPEANHKPILLKDFIEKYVGKNTLIRLWNKCEVGHKQVDGDNCKMEWELLKSNYANIPFLYVKDIVVIGSPYSDALNVVIEKI